MTPISRTRGKACSFSLIAVLRIMRLIILDIGQIEKC